MPQPTWAEIEQTIRTVIAQASGLQAIWKFQNADSPPLDYVAISLGTSATVWYDYTVEYYRGSDAPVGQEIGIAVGGTREVSLQIEGFSSATVEQVNKATALSIVDGIVTSLRLPTLRATLAAVGVTPFAPGTTVYVPEIVSTGFRGRASNDVRCYMPARAVEEYTTYIASITGSATIKGSASGGDITLPIAAP